jgi:hypothetical protein
MNIQQKKHQNRSTEQYSEEKWVEFWRWQSKVTEEMAKKEKGIRLCKKDFMCDLKLQ